MGFRLILMLALFGAVMLSACGGGSGPGVEPLDAGSVVPADEADGVSEGTAIPGLDSLAQHGTSAAGPFCYGDEFRGDIGTHLCYGTGLSRVSFEPRLTSHPPYSQEIAYSIYSVQPESAEEPAELTIWLSQHNDPDDMFVAVSNYQLNHWEWVRQEYDSVDDVFTVEVDPRRLLTEDTQLHILLVFTGTDAWVLDGLGFTGCPVQSTATVQDYLSGPSGTEMPLENYNYYGSWPVEFTWEFGTAAVEPVSHEESPVITLNELGEHACRLTIDNEYGDPLVKEFTINVIEEFDGWFTLFNPAQQSSQMSPEQLVVQPSGESYIAALHSVNPVEIVLSRLDAGGYPAQMKAVQHTGDLDLLDLAVSSTGEQFVLGKAFHQFLLRLDADGEFVSCNRWVWDTSGVINGNRLAVAADDSVYVAGSGYVPDVGNGSGIIKISAEGSVEWQRVFYLPDIDDSFELLGAEVDQAGNIICAGIIRTFLGDDYRLAFLKYDSDGNLIWRKQLAMPGATSTYSGLSLDQAGNIFLMTEYSIWEPEYSSQKVVLKLSPEGELLQSIGLNSNNFYLYDTCTDPATGDLLIGGMHVLPDSEHDCYVGFIGRLGNDLDPVSAQAWQWGQEFSWKTIWDLYMDDQGRLYTTGHTAYSTYSDWSELDFPLEAYSTGTLEDISVTTVDCTATTLPVTLTVSDFYYEYSRQPGEYTDLTGMFAMRYDGFSE